MPIILRTGGGGSSGASLNYSFTTATTYAGLPSTPDENTFGIITSTAIPEGGASIQPVIPLSGMSEGDVVIITGPDSPYPFEVSIGSEAYIYPVTAYQYISSSWTSIEAYIYQDSTWSQLWIRYYYDGTTGMISWSSWSTGQGAVADMTTYLRGTIGTGGTSGGAIWRTASQVDMSQFTTLELSYYYTHGSKGSWGAYIYLYPIASLATYSSCPTNDANLSLSTGTRTVSFDVSGVTADEIIHTKIGKSSYYDSGELRTIRVIGK